VQGASEEEITDALRNCKDFGFVNYYGLQRFGTRSLSTDAPGICMLAEKWEEAVDMILGDREEGCFDD
jgi:tRNA pseudouridine13 synthase